MKYDGIQNKNRFICDMKHQGLYSLSNMSAICSMIGLCQCYFLNHYMQLPSARIEYICVSMSIYTPAPHRF